MKREQLNTFLQEELSLYISQNELNKLFTFITSHDEALYAKMDAIIEKDVHCPEELRCQACPAVNEEKERMRTALAKLKKGQE